MAETTHGLFKADLTHRRGSWPSFDAVKYATLEWVDRFNNRRLTEPIGDILPAEAEANVFAALERSNMAVHPKQITRRHTRRGSVTRSHAPFMVRRFFPDHTFGAGFCLFENQTCAGRL